MKINEVMRMRSNEKVSNFAECIMNECEKCEFTVSDMKDLAVILKSKISKAITSNEEHDVFRNPAQK